MVQDDALDISKQGWGQYIRATSPSSGTMEANQKNYSIQIYDAATLSSELWIRMAAQELKGKQLSVYLNQLVVAETRVLRIVIA
jgi:hypothetical protein